ncbi:hypothetical protein O7606_15445 [Micromonospora sp. WMMD882]|uniref:hypothetical protein n=1 Tax=Micromonospora sp. WMMD882 TaxID=3015151 RepID=UPI00248AFB3A|nr:hypothetical protein [Micromonospora sp. WMMD882]WBB77667.1 hypothetical protein O7606_15445 [Micromonospora sp. WMMD882]
MTDTDHPGRTAAADRAWTVLLPADRYEAERLVHHDTLELTGLAARPRPAPGDPVAVVVAGESPLLVALGRISSPPAGEAPAREAAAPLVVAYTRWAFDEPVPADGLPLDGPVSELPADRWRSLADRLGPPPPRRSWLVSLDLPIEAATPAEAVRLFWSYVRELGPRELPAYVSPSGDELAMQAFVLGVEANQDPEEDD